MAGPIANAIFAFATATSSPADLPQKVESALPGAKVTVVQGSTLRADGLNLSAGEFKVKASEVAKATGCTLTGVVPKMAKIAGPGGRPIISDMDVAQFTCK